MNALLLVSVLLPLGLAVLIAFPTRFRGPLLALAPWTGLPALALAIPGLRPAEVNLPWALLGARLGLDATGQVFLLFTALLWTCAGIYASSYLRTDRRRVTYFVFHLLAMSGNLAIVVAQDLVTFYAFFALMTFAAYPLIIHAGGAEALRAGRVYIVMAVLGETLLLAGLLMAAGGSAGLGLDEVRAAIADARHRELIAALLLTGFGIKAGALPLHVWLPLAHPVAPTPASAVLSGCMIKAGLLGWIRFLPLGDAAIRGAGLAVLALGLAAAFFGIVIGVTQQNAKTTLAYSSISQIGIINFGMGIALVVPATWPTVRAAVLTYAVHHGLAKGALFLGVGVAAAAGREGWARRSVAAGLLFPALALAGAPLTSGSIAKEYLKEVSVLSPGFWPVALEWLLPLAAVGTTLLMARFLVVVRAEADDHPPQIPPPRLWVPWAALLIATAFLVRTLPGAYRLELDPEQAAHSSSIWLSIWPIAAGAILAWSALLLAARGSLRASRWRIAPGDLLIPVEGLAHNFGAWLRRPETTPTGTLLSSLSSRWYALYREPPADLVAGVERNLLLWSSAGLALVLLTLLLSVLLFLP